ncbi:unnamed protein product [Vitrella brassicaformis CCMP3155]|uniref:Phospho-2-dehydro-3-deoxyheptonate aldolase n=2 Tax=Vitrella brassicaformis TaxID=1169539 RepID=A0A0G4EHY6_VITBC|nr:unnamed protein product [Vitrella brassicaformis CCMP3155]|mmetsp:Transcript_10534/g.25555  ORF Transcript_10534/g.25555 Transcript_10534/m.25555 type:complete len:499 (+) Transcript_10534:190-1686(+)|eukprot:CEL95852.1 unnamed protein product [Vitrella brassicaformis CCMP3155]
MVREREMDASTSCTEDVAGPPAKKQRMDMDSPSSPARPWDPLTWKALPSCQNPFASVMPAAVASVERQLSALPPLVYPTEVQKLRGLLEEVHGGQRFLLQGGDCAERFLDCSASVIAVKLKILLQMSLVLSYAGRKPTVRIARIAGQYGKPRSSAMETVNGQQVPSFRGDNVNDMDPNNRTPDPERLVKAYFHSAATLNYLRALLTGGFADLHESKHWELEYVNSKERRLEYEALVENLLDGLSFLDVCGATGEASKTVDLFTSHEALVLPYEAAMTRRFNGQWFNTSAHLVWIGDRTRQLDHAHVEYCRGIENPVGIKVGPSAPPSEIVDLCKRLDPQNQPGKLVLITRLGAKNVQTHLPPLIKAAKEAGLNVIFQCDPMHGNTEKASSGHKTRRFDTVLEELLETFKTHKAHGSHLGGVHFEMTGEDVTECTGGPQEIDDTDLHIRYTTYCDPRLNYAQSLEMAFKLAACLKSDRRAPFTSSGSAHDIEAPPTTHE